MKCQARTRHQRSDSSGKGSARIQDLCPIERDDHSVEIPVIEDLTAADPSQSPLACPEPEYPGNECPDDCAKV